MFCWVNDMSKKFRRVCKDKYAAMTMLPHPLEQDVINLHDDLGLFRIIPITKMLDRLNTWAYFSCRYINERSSNDKAAVKARSTTRTRWSQSSSRSNTGALVSIGRFLRSRRHGSGQVRDVASCSGRRCLQGRGGSIVRNVQANVLSSRERLCQRRAATAAPQTARAQRRTQTQLDGHGVHRRTLTARRHHPRSRACAGDRNRAGSIGPPTQYRTRASTQKKTVDDSARFMSPSSALGRYEALRADLFGAGPNSEGHAAIRFHCLLNGLAIQLSHASCTEAAGPAVFDSNPVRVNGAAVRVLANLVLRAHEGLAYVY